jgi:hypothetical protein
VVEDVEFLKSFSSLNEHCKISGLLLNTFTGVLKKMVWSPLGIVFKHERGGVGDSGI